MANQPEIDQWDASVYQLEKTDPVLAGLGGVTNAPLVNLTNRTRYLYNRIAEILGIAKSYVVAGGTANAITCSYTPTVTAVVSGQVFKGKVAASNTGAVTFTPNPAGTGGIAPLPVYGQDVQPLTGGEIVGNFAVQYDAALNGGNGGYILIDNPGGILRTVTPALADNGNSVPNTSWVRWLFGTPPAIGGGVRNSAKFTSLDANAGATVAGGLSSDTLTVSGVAQVSNPAAGDNTTKVATTAWFKAEQATETNQGTAKVATQAITNAGTDDATYVTPKKLRAGFSMSLGATGYLAFPSWLGGLILQWGSTTVPANGTNGLITLPLAMPNAIFSASLTPQTPPGSAPVGIAVASKSTLTTQCQGTSAVACYFIVIGN